MKLYIDVDGVLNNLGDIGDAMGVNWNELDGEGWDELLQLSSPTLFAVKVNRWCEMYPGLITLLTKCPDGMEEPKRKWLAQHVPAAKDIICVPTNIHKHEMVEAKGNLLIDDYEGYIDGWVRAGGYCFQYIRTGVDLDTALSLTFGKFEHKEELVNRYSFIDENDLLDMMLFDSLINDLNEGDLKRFEKMFDMEEENSGR